MLNAKVIISENTLKDFLMSLWMKPDGGSRYLDYARGLRDGEEAMLLKITSYFFDMDDFTYEVNRISKVVKERGPGPC